MAETDEPDPGEELAQAVADGDEERIVAILMGNVWYFLTHDYRALQDAAATLSDEMLERHPVLRIAHPLGGVLVRTSRPFDPSEFDALTATGDPTTVGLFTMIQGIALRAGGDIAAALRSFRRLEDWIRQSEFAGSAQHDGPLWLFHHQIGSTFLMAGDTLGALRQLGVARQIGISSTSGGAQRSAAGRIAVAYAVRGSLGEAERSLAEALALPSPTAAYASAAFGTERTAAALLSVERLAEDADERIAELDAIDNFEIIWPFELLARIRLALGRQQPSEALELVTVASATHLVQEGSFASDLVDATRIEALLALGDISGAERAASASSSRGPLTRIAAAQASVHRGDLAEAQEDLRYLGTRAALSPMQRAQLAALAARLEALRGGQVSPHLAEEFAASVTRQGFRRLATTMPATVVPLIRARLSPSAAAAFDAATADLHFAGPAGSITRALTESERRVLEALVAHETVADIAAALHVSPNTVKTQLRSVYRKIGVTNRADAVAVGSRLATATYG
ncbi:helix-turn-helix transcriptional regulator [Gryllotalpicola protaetiae]|uniref:LuxR family transcriptional regulator n=1 Tax=Gryllotalpicola protaetiae TaxID=2419771 RepID=A0A387BI12_9MICO|nr:helix-turn-helix transcriptional regulator [Gryllotalpicola protaetiae]AYG02318.1 LuxR family transcriptional regulator [Gryllotalpicola protaetiae]